ncbi:MAG: hypothetical protein IJV27_02990 [Prevotella sp.]|nr:hypothetical protein [Prevotella sp.]
MGTVVPHHTGQEVTGSHRAPYFYALKCGWVDSWVDRKRPAKTKCIEWVDVWVDTFNTFGRV